MDNYLFKKYIRYICQEISKQNISIKVILPSFQIKLLQKKILTF